MAGHRRPEEERVEIEQEHRQLGWFFETFLVCFTQCFSKIKGNRGAIYLMLSLCLAETWCETNQECLKNPP